MIPSTMEAGRETVLVVHERAMSLVDRAHVARSRQRYRNFMRRAFLEEWKAASMAIYRNTSEATQVILLRSAANLALAARSADGDTEHANG